MNIAIFYGKPVEGAGKDEQDTLVQAETIAEILHLLGHVPIHIPLSFNLQEALDAFTRHTPELVFNLVESIAAHGRLIHIAPALLDVLQLPYTGAGTNAMFLTSNKLLAKQQLACAGLPTPVWFSAKTLQRNPVVTHNRYILKSVWEHASIGLSEAATLETHSAAELWDFLLTHGEQQRGESFFEAYIEGREFNLSLLAGKHGVEVLPPAEISFDSYPIGKLRIVDYRAKWEEESFEYQNTPRRFNFVPEDGSLLENLKTLARRCWDLFELRGYARVDFRVDQNNQPWILEINANPCLSPDAGFMAAAAQAGVTMPQVVERIINDM
ncbi:hypothetical protein U27_05177 [Candidatus Vecturithrix granuli]|uniref:ATP-grasp domain-containing protein n=1 Tax=Vecturithrix granuli TaxID=1499967 RepID=A0A081C0U9_VECG1|nr:hypothetical protein U27_05177 [Candidatus Vecturithrix granuli]